MYKVEIICDSLSPKKERLTSFLITYPRIIHAEMLRHRMISRNTASSRAIPFKKMIKDVEENPFVPIAWQKDHSGMQGTEYYQDEQEMIMRRHWVSSMREAVHKAKELHAMGLTKQLCNRIVEAFVWTTELITTSTDGLENFFALRCPQYEYQGKIYRSKKDCIKQNPQDRELLEFQSLLNWLQINKSQAEIHIQKIAEMMWDAYNENKPKQLEVGEWHMPKFGWKISIENLKPLAIKYEGNDSFESLQKIALKISVANCARLSYHTLGDNPKIDYEADIKLHDKLLIQNHMSPFEHCAKVMTDYEYDTFIKGKGDWYQGDEGIEFKDKSIYGWCKNFKGFIPYRYFLESLEG